MKQDFPHSLKLVWALTVCLVAMAAASAGCIIWCLHVVDSERALLVRHNNTANELNAKWSRALGILEEEGLIHAGNQGSR